MFNKKAYKQIKEEIPKDVKILAATKTKSIEDIKQAIDSGINLIGENYVQEAEEKFKIIKDILKEKNIEFHLIGHLQSNKVKEAVKIFDCIESIDSIKLANKLNNTCEELNKKINIFIEVNFDEEQKSGIKINELDNLVIEIKKLNNLNLIGFMTIPPIGKERDSFKKLKLLKDQYNLKELSIGMSSDYKLAIENNSTLIRLGTLLFGERK